MSTTSPCLNEKPALVSNAASLAGLDIPAELRDVAVRSHGLDRTMVRIPKSYVLIMGCSELWMLQEMGPLSS
ncbi:MAG TPA: hypothetical protein PLT52_02910 [Acetomicrobium sp.]|uniref:hypothetical protein n=1 Tax=Acetomicrobium sp. TaxID=1872099 RepID=UPI002B25F580|nr:hypothetical protein [Acetomicrobium sp.]HPT64834.1 hypothetical protein [Acetomicrobium sp.]